MWAGTVDAGAAVVAGTELVPCSSFRELTSGTITPAAIAVTQTRRIATKQYFLLWSGMSLA